MDTQHLSVQGKLAELETKLGTQTAIAEHLTRECADKGFRIRQLEEELEAALADKTGYKELATTATNTAALEQAECLDRLVTEFKAARDALRDGYRLNQDMQAILPDLMQLNDVRDDLDAQTKVLRTGYDRIEGFIQGNEEDVRPSIPSESVTTAVA